MSKDRMTRVNELLKREIGRSLFLVMNERNFDISAITVTRVSTSPDLRDARVYVSIRDHEDVRDKMLRRIRSHRRDIQGMIGKNVVLKYTPKLSFTLDTSIEKGDRVLGLMADMGLEDDDIPPGDEL